MFERSGLGLSSPASRAAPLLAAALVLPTLFAIAPPAAANHGGPAVGDVHWHAPWALYINGEKQSFDADRYQVQANFVHVEGGNGDRIHVHARGATLGEFLSTLGWGLTSDCLTTDDGRELCEGPDADLTVRVNGAAIEDPASYEIQDGDQILVSYQGPTVEENALQTPAQILGGLLVLGGATYAYRAYRGHRRRQDLQEGSGRQRSGQAGPGADAPIWEVDQVQRGAAAAVVGLLVVGAGFTLLSPTVQDPGPRPVSASGYAQVHYLASTPDGAVVQSTLANPSTDPANGSAFAEVSPEADPVWTYAGRDRPKFTPPGVPSQALAPIVPAVRTALSTHAEGDTFTVGPLSPEEAYGPVDESLIETHDLVLELDRNQTPLMDDVQGPDGSLEEGENVTVTTDPGARLPARVQEVLQDRVRVRLTPENGSPVALDFWNATVTTTNTTVRLTQHPVEGRTYGSGDNRFRVTEVTESTYTEDWNHPLAGETLTFRVHVAYVPPAPGGGDRKPAPALSLSQVGGGQFRLSEEPGKVVVLTSMGAWCSTCKLEAQNIGQVAPKYSQDQVRFVEVGITPNRDSMSDLARFKENYGGDWTFTMDDGTFLKKYEVSAMDETFIVTPDGKIAFHDTGITQAETFQRQIDRLLAEYGLQGGSA